MKLRFSREGTAGAPLLYWLLIVCGLAGLTIMRLDNPSEVVPVWIGTLAGVALGQTLAWQRIRGWIPAVIAICGLWFAPVLYFILYDALGSDAEVATLAFLPAAVCGYLSFSERGALVAFWYPAVLWMLAILDGSSSAATLSVSTALPLAVGLAVLFIAFLRARESRRVALWRKHASEKLAEPVAEAVVRASPMRSASQFAYTGFVGVSALVLAAWIAPHLWQLEKAKEQHAREVAALNATQMQSGYNPTVYAPPVEPCCWDETLVVEEKKVKVREYLPLVRGHSEHNFESAPVPMSMPEPTSCRACGGARATYTGPGFSGYSAQPWTWSDDGQYVAGGVRGDGWGNAGGGYYGYNNGGYNNGGYYNGYYNNGVYAPPVVQPPVVVPPVVVPPVVPTTTTVKKHVPPPHGKHVPKTPVTAVPPPPPPPPPPIPEIVTPSIPPPPPAPVVVVAPARAPKDIGTPWQWTLGLCLTGLGLHLLLRAMRRTLTLRHLARPFWAETLDQQVSNHWQRMLIGLGDAGIHPAREEQPQAFARRVGIEGMTTCATILERVRHGVRLEDGDLETMDSAATGVYRSARSRAGILGRMTAWLRWPLAEDPQS